MIHGILKTQGQIAGRSSRSRTGDRGQDREGQGETQILPGPVDELRGVLFFDPFLLMYTVGLAIFCLPLGEYTKLAGLFTIMFYTSSSCALSFIHAQHFSFIPYVFF